MTKGEISKQTGVPVRTLRFYEDKGIIPKQKRGSNSYRIYDKSMIPRLKFIKNAQQLGFSLNEIKEIAEMKISPDLSCESVHQKAMDKISDIENKINDLNHIKDVLTRFAQCCSPEKGIEECEIIHLMEDLDNVE